MESMVLSEKEVMERLFTPAEQAEVEGMAAVMALQLEMASEAPGLLQHVKERGVEFCLKSRDGHIFDMAGHKLAA